MKLESDVRDREGSGCCSSVCRCLARIPCLSLSVFLILIGALVAFIGSLFVGFHRTRALIDQPDMWPWFLYACIGVAVGMLPVASMYLAVASVSATMSYTTDKQNLCLRVAKCIVLVLGVVLQLAWILLTVVASVPLSALLMFANHVKKAQCANLSHYGLPKQQAVMCGDELTKFNDEVQRAELLVCFTASLVCAVIVTVALSLLLINTAYNFAKLQIGKCKSAGSGYSRPPGHVIGAYSDGMTSPETVM